MKAKQYKNISGGTPNNRIPDRRVLGNIHRMLRRTGKFKKHLRLNRQYKEMKKKKKTFLFNRRQSIN
jgi:hypothetical protein